jgi:predicted nucleotidyltransferase
MIASLSVPRLGRVRVGCGAVNLLHPLDSILGSTAKVDVLRTLYRAGHPLAGREIGRRAGVGSGHVSRVLRDLVATGVVEQWNHGSVNLYALRRVEHPVIEGMVGLFRAEDDRLRRVVESVAATDEAILAVIVFGSEARGDATAQSDTDLLVVVRPGSKARVEERFVSVMLDLAAHEFVATSWLVHDLDDIAAWEQTGNALWRNIRRDGRSLAGASIEEVRRLCRHGASG